MFGFLKFIHCAWVNGILTFSYLVILNLGVFFLRHSSRKYVLSAYCVSDTILGTGAIVNKTEDNHCPHALTSSSGRRTLVHEHK